MIAATYATRPADRRLAARVRGVASFLAATTPTGGGMPRIPRSPAPRGYDTEQRSASPLTILGRKNRAGKFTLDATGRGSGGARAVMQTARKAADKNRGAIFERIERVRECLHVSANGVKR